MPTTTTNGRILLETFRASSPDNLNWDAKTPAGDFSIATVTTLTKGDPIIGWRRKIATRRQATTGLSFSGWEVNSTPGKMVLLRQNYSLSGKPTTQLYGLLEGHLLVKSGTTLAPATISLTRARNQALMSFLSKASSARTSLTGGVVLGELGETLRFMRGPLKGAWRLLLIANRKAKKTVRKAKTRRQRDSARRAIGDQYLETVFAVNPLLSDVNGAAKALANIVNYRMPSAPVRGYGQERSNQSVSETSRSTTNGSLKMTHVDYDLAECRIYGVITMRSGFAGGLEELGLLPGDFLPTLWNVLPYSFIADYFSNAGAIIESTSFCRSDFAFVNEGTRISRNRECVSHTPVIPAGTSTAKYSVDTLQPGNCSISRLNLLRSAYNGPWTPSFEVKVPGMSMKWFNMAALLNARV